MASKFMRQILLKTNRHVDKFFLEKIVNNTKKKSIDLNEKKRRNEIKRKIVISKRKKERRGKGKRKRKEEMKKESKKERGKKDKISYLLFLRWYQFRQCSHYTTMFLFLTCCDYCPILLLFVCLHNR